MNKKRILTLGGLLTAIVLVLLVVFGSSGANAAVRHLFGSKDIRNNSLQSVDIKNGTIKSYDLSASTRSYLKGKRGPAGVKGDTGDPGQRGPQGFSSVMNVYYVQAFYNAGDTNAGAIATVACKKQTDTAISGGVQILGLDDGAAASNARNTPVSSSFPGRMDWGTNQPLAARLDGWIVQFGGGIPPLKTKIWALCTSESVGGPFETYRQND